MDELPLCSPPLYDLSAGIVRLLCCQDEARYACTNFGVQFFVANAHCPPPTGVVVGFYDAPTYPGRSTVEVEKIASFMRDNNV
jgi:hypothetical protein